MAGLLALVLLFAAGAQACLLPPGGCKVEVCNGYSGMIIPATNGPNYGDASAWATSSNSKIAFIRSSFNKNINSIGPGGFTYATWLAMANGLGKITSGPPVLPSVNFEYYSLDGATYTVAGASGNLADCCNACRLADSCSEYFYVPKAVVGTKDTTGTCYFIAAGPVPGDGPWKTDPKSGAATNVGSLNVLTKSQTSSKMSNAATYPTYNQGFLGGYCNGNKFPSGGAVTDDPHFTGAHGTRFDFNGELNKAFCLLTDKSIHINALLKGYKSENTFGATVGADGKALRSWIREVGIIWTGTDGASHSLHLVARSGKDNTRGAGFLAAAEVDGQAVAIPAVAGSSFTQGDLTFTFLGVGQRGPYALDKFEVVVAGQLDMTFHMRVAHPKLQTETEAHAHFNLMFNTVKVSDKVHGVLGQTYRETPSQVFKAVKYSELSKLLGGPVQADGVTGAGFLEGAVTDYEASSVLQPDCKVSAFSA